jgi:hypothetical protein
VNYGGSLDELNGKRMKDLYKISRVETFVEVRIVYH